MKQTLQWEVAIPSDTARRLSSMAMSLIVENLLPEFGRSFINYLQQCYWGSPIGSSELQSNTATQLWTMASQKLDSIYWTLPPTLYRAVPYERQLHGANACQKSLVSREPNTVHTLLHTRQAPCLCSHSGFKLMTYLRIIFQRWKTS